MLGDAAGDLLLGDGLAPDGVTGQSGEDVGSIGAGECRRPGQDVRGVVRGVVEEHRYQGHRFTEAPGGDEVDRGDALQRFVAGLLVGPIEPKLPGCVRFHVSGES